jgi:very-short-patch-repair endonuclease
VIELDGYDNHSSRAQLRRDKRNDLALRSHGLTVLRYDWALLHDRPEQVYEDLIRARSQSSSSPT